MNDSLATTGLIPLCIGSVETFQEQPWLDGLPWNLAGGTVSLKLADPVGNTYTIPATVSGYTATATWTVIGPVGNWARAWQNQDASGIIQVSRPICFSVISSPS
jgi:hypothetical protein